MINETSLPSVTRVEVIDKNGRSYTNHKVADLHLSYQDDGRTLKIFIAEESEYEE